MTYNTTTTATAIVHQNTTTALAHPSSHAPMTPPPITQRPPPITQPPPPITQPPPPMSLSDTWLVSTTESTTTFAASDGTNTTAAFSSHTPLPMSTDTTVDPTTGEITLATEIIVGVAIAAVVVAIVAGVVLWHRRRTRRRQREALEQEKVKMARLTKLPPEAPDGRTDGPDATVAATVAESVHIAALTSDQTLMIVPPSPKASPPTITAAFSPGGPVPVPLEPNQSLDCLPMTGQASNASLSGNATGEVSSSSPQPLHGITPIAAGASPAARIRLPPALDTDRSPSAEPTKNTAAAATGGAATSTTAASPASRSSSIKLARSLHFAPPFDATPSPTIVSPLPLGSGKNRASSTSSLVTMPPPATTTCAATAVVPNNALVATAAVGVITTRDGSVASMPKNTFAVAAVASARRQQQLQQQQDLAAAALSPTAGSASPSRRRFGSLHRPRGTSHPGSGPGSPRESQGSSASLRVRSNTTANDHPAQTTPFVPRRGMAESTSNHDLLEFSTSSQRRQTRVRHGSLHRDNNTDETVGTASGDGSPTNVNRNIGGEDDDLAFATSERDGNAAFDGADSSMRSVMSPLALGTPRRAELPNHGDAPELLGLPASHAAARLRWSSPPVVGPVHVSSLTVNMGGDDGGSVTTLFTPKSALDSPNAMAGGRSPMAAMGRVESLDRLALTLPTANLNGPPLGASSRDLFMAAAIASEPTQPQPTTNGSTTGGGGGASRLSRIANNRVTVVGFVDDDGGVVQEGHDPSSLKPEEITVWAESPQDTTVSLPTAEP